jgi:hypothetical protein
MDRLLASKELFPSFRVVGKLCEGLSVVGTTTELSEQGLKLWFPNLNETGRIVVEWEKM